MIEPTDSQQWMAIEELMRTEKRAEAEEVLQRRAAEAEEWSGRTPLLHIREGQVQDELLSLIEEDSSISILVLGAATGTQGPGPLVTHLSTRIAGRLPIPITIVPGALSDTDLARLA